MDNTIGIIGLAKRAGALLVGTDAVVGGIRKGKVRLVVIASDVSDNTLKKLKDKCLFFNINYDIAKYSREKLGAILGKNQISAVAITDTNFYNGYMKKRRNGKNSKEMPMDIQDLKEVDAYVNKR